MLLTLGVTAPATAAASQSTKGTVFGAIDVTTGSASLEPTDAVTVKLLAGHKVVATERVARNARFRLRVASGHYSLGVAGSPSCLGQVRVKARHTTGTLVVCTLIRALRSVAFATLPMSGAITTSADAMKRYAATTKNGTSRLDATETTRHAYEVLSTAPITSPVPPLQSPPTPVWVTCAGGGTYTSFNGTSGYGSTCRISTPTSGTSIGNVQMKEYWPPWFTRLPLLGPPSPDPVTPDFTSITRNSPGWSVTLTVKKTTVRAGTPIPATLVVTNRTGRSVRYSSCRDNGVFGMGVANHHVPQGLASGAVACSASMRPGRNIFHETVWTNYESCSPSVPPCRVPLPGGIYHTIVLWPKFAAQVPRPGSLAIRLTPNPNPGSGHGIA